MNHYELVVIFKPDLTEEQRNSAFDRIKQAVEENGELGKTDEWGLRKLAYEINYIKEGYYIVQEMNLDPSAVKEVERRCRLLDEVIRFMVSRVEE